MSIRLAALLVGLLLSPAAASAAPTLDRVGSFDSPVYAVSPPGDARLFVVEQGGTVRIVGEDGATRGTPFLDVTDEIGLGGERGLLSIAFAPDYATNGAFYVYATAPDGDVQVLEYQRSAGDPDVADPSTRRLVIEQAHKSAPNHNGGGLQFTPDGRLWISIGDGGGANDDTGPNAQRLTTLLGKLLRIDPRPTATAPFAVPDDNPFVGRAGARAEIWAYGLRNPFRFSFDRRTGDLWIGDVGQGKREEIDVAAAAGAGGLGRGANYGWVCFEGSIRTPGVTPCEAPGHVQPFLERDHDADGVCSITAGVVVRDPGLPTLAGRYLYGDFCAASVRAVAPGDAASDRAAGFSVSSVAAFGEDACGRVYTVSLEGPVSRLRDGAATPCDLPEAPAAPAGAAPVPGSGSGSGPSASVTAAPADTTPCRIAIRRSSRQRVGALRLAVTTSERCTVRATLRAKGVATLRSATRTLEAGRRSTLRLRATARAARGARSGAAAVGRS